jgi:hypothetical protein
VTLKDPPDTTVVVSHGKSLETFFLLRISSRDSNSLDSLKGDVIPVSTLLAEGSSYGTGMYLELVSP